MILPVPAVTLGSDDVGWRCGGIVVVVGRRLDMLSVFQRKIIAESLKTWRGMGGYSEARVACFKF